MVGNSKMSSFFLLGYPQTPTRASPAELGEGAGGAETYIQQKIMWYIKSGVFNSRDFKNEISFPFRILSDPNKSVAGGALGGRGAETYTQQKIMWYIKSGVFISRDFKNEISFPFRIPSDPNKGITRGALGGVEGGADTYTWLKIMWYIKSGVFNSRDFKNEISFPFRIPSDPNKGVAGGALGRGKGGWDLYTIKDNVIYQFWCSQ